MSILKLTRVFLRCTIFRFILALSVAVFLLLNGIEKPRQRSVVIGGVSDVFEIPFIVVMCKGSSHTNQASQVSPKEMQQRQVEVLLKSAAALTSKKLRFILVTDDPPMFKSIAIKVLQWPGIYRNRLSLQYKRLYVPNDATILNLYDKCSAEKLFMPWVLPELSHGVVLDTDMIFMRPPEHLAQTLNNFKDKEFLGAAPPLGGYYLQPDVEIPFYKRQGLNGSPLVVNFSRWRQLPFDWRALVESVYINFQYRLRLGDQDIFNIIFSEYPEYVHDIDCDWNGSIEQCVSSPFLCETTQETGFSLVHGLRWHFFRDEFLRKPELVIPMRVIFRSWEEHLLGTPIRALLNDMMYALNYIKLEFAQQKFFSFCSFPDKKLLNQLQSYVDKVET